MEATVLDIQRQISEGVFVNEAAIIRGILNPILQKLNWPVNDVRVVRPEYTIENQRVDIALFHNNQPLVFIEAKKIGYADGAEKQLFEYAFHAGVPILILTDGPTWHFFLSSGIGNYEQRKVNKLDLTEYEDIKQICSKFNDYLEYHNVISGRSKQILEDEFKSIYRDREVKNTLPIAWGKIINDEDDLLYEIIANKVEELCNYQPNKKMVFDFLNNIFLKDRETQVSIQSSNNLTSAIRTKPSASLGFTRIVQSRFGKRNAGSKWSNLISIGLELCAQRNVNIIEIKRNTSMNIVHGEEHERGYKYVQKANISYQGMDANKSWENALKIAQLLREEIYIEFEWTNNNNAAYPGRKEILYWEP